MKLLLFSIFAFAVACTPARQQSSNRTPIEPLPPINEKITAKLESYLFDPNASAVNRVASLAQDTKIANRFLYLSAIGKDRDGQLAGRVEIASNPFLRYSITAAVKRDDIDTFIKQAHAAHDAGEISGAQWLAFQAAEGIYNTTHNSFVLRKLQTKAINGKVAATFPGIFGGTNPIEKSLPLLWIRKFDSSIDVENSDVKKSLGANTPLVSLSEFGADVQESLSAAIAFYPFDRRLPQAERAASLVLFQRMWSQLLTLKGYNGVAVVTTQGQAAIAPLADNQNAYSSVNHLGYFIDLKTHQNLNLSPEDIAGYDPAKRLILLGAGPGQFANLQAELSLLSGLGLAFEATSPAAYFVSGPQTYLLGDVTSLKNRAVIPEEAHSLALGLLGMELKNLVARNIVQVNANGQDVNVAGGEVRGLVLIDDTKTVQLENVLRMIKFYVQMDSTVTQLLKADHTQLALMNSLYQDKNGTFDKLMDMQYRFKSLRTGLFLLTMGLVRSQSESASWDPKLGLKFDGKGLTQDRKRQIGAILRDLAIEMDQPLILSEANKLLGVRE